VSINNPDRREDESDANRDVLMEPLKYTRVGSDGEGGSGYIVPAGYSTDFASVPWFLRWVFPRRGQYSRAAILHDYLCDQWESGVTRLEADAVFVSCMRELGVPWWQRASLFLAVRLFAMVTGKDFR